MTDQKKNHATHALEVLQQDDWIHSKVCSSRADKRQRLTTQEVAIKLKKRAAEFDPNKSTGKHNLE